MIVFITIRYTAFRNTERQVPPVVRRGRDAVARANRHNIPIPIMRNGDETAVFPHPGQPVRAGKITVAVGIRRAGFRPAGQRPEVAVAVVANPGNIVRGRVLPRRAVPPVVGGAFDLIAVVVGVAVPGAHVAVRGGRLAELRKINRAVMMVREAGTKRRKVIGRTIDLDQPVTHIVAKRVVVALQILVLYHTGGID